MKHNLLSLFFAAIVAMNVFATDVWDGSSDIFTHGSGTEQSPYLIENAEQLAFIAEMVNAGIYTYSGNYFKLTTDLDLNNIPWTPIGDTEEHQFGGNFDGDNHTISNLYISSATNAGLFGVVSGGVYKKITIHGEIPSSANATNAGGLIANATSAISIDSCVNNVSINGGHVVGGLVGMGVNTSISNSQNTAMIIGDSIAGGLLGSCPNTLISVINKCINKGIIKSQSIAGGIVGAITKVHLISCFNTGCILSDNTWKYTQTSQSTLHEGYYYRAYWNVYAISKESNIVNVIIGGIAGVATNSIFDSCANQEMIKTIIMGEAIEPNTLSYSNKMDATNTAIMYSYKRSITCYAGGICGSFSGNINNCYNTGNIICDESHGIDNYSYIRSYTWTDVYNLRDDNAAMAEFRQTIAGLSGSINKVVSGIVGQTIDTTFIEKCYNKGKITDSGAGLVGITSTHIIVLNNGNKYHRDYDVTIKNSYNVGSVQNGIGGLSENYTTFNTINSYNAGNTTNYGISPGAVTNSYYINGTGNGTQKTEAQMKSAAMPILLNADSTVFIQDTKPNVNKGYPIFKNGMKYIATNDASDVSYTSATLHGNYYNCAPLSMGFEYKEDTATNYIYQTVSNASPAQYELTNLTQGTTYVARYWLVDNGIKYFGDTIHFTTLACPTEPVRSDTVRLCQGESYEFAGKTLTQAGVYHDSLVATTGCDSVVELVLQVTDTYKYPRTETINRGESYDFYGQLLTEPGVYNEYIRTTNRCNWIELTLIVHEPDKTLTLNVNNPQWGTVLGAGTFEHGTVAEFSAVPAEGCYFVNWSDGETNAVRAIALTKDTIITANFAIHQFTITTEATNGSVSGGGTYNYGTQVTLTATADEHYHFVRWNDGNTEATRQITVTENKTYSAVFELDNFLVTFRNADGTELKSEEVEYGVMPVAPADPTKESTAQYDYTFAGWTPTIAIVTQAATYTATYTPVLREYLVTFLNEDNTVISSKNYKYGETPIAPADPVKQNTAEYTYTFNGWDHAIAQVQGPQTYKATFTASKNSYTITWQNEDGSLIDQTTVEYGVVPTHTDPIKQNTAEYTYTFAGWTPAVVAVIGNATYKATFLATKNSYTITWQNEDGSLIDQTTVEYGVVPTHAEPTKQATAEYTYTFAGWTPVVVAVTGDATYKATFTASKNSYTITWQNEDGSLIDQTIVEYGQIPAHADPVKQNTAEYTYTFAGWTPAVGAVTGNATYKATFTASKNSYTITWQDENGSLIDQTTVEYGQIPAHANPVKQNTAEYTYTFSGWTPTVVAVTGSATYRATFSATKNKYLITFRNDDGTVLKSEEVEYGMLPIAPATPTKESTAQYNYEFAGWTPSVTLVSQAVTYTATYNSSVREYLVTFLNDDNSVISMQSCKYGSYPTIPSTPTKQATAEFSYTFAGWTPNIVAVSGDVTYKATFNATRNSYTITWQDENGALIDQTTVEYGQIPAHADPIKQNTAEYTYTFAGWTPAVVAVTGNATYKATFTATKNSYTITWQDENGSLIDQTTVEYGQIPAHADPVKQNTAEYTYTFAGWSPAVVAVTGDATYKATFTATKNSYTITWQNEDGSLIDQTTVEYGVVPTHAEPTKEATEEYTYTFSGWTPAVVAVTGDATYKATFSSVVNVYTISVSAANGQVIGGGEYQYGATIDLTAIPNEGYVFDQWSDGVKDNPRTITVTGNAEYTALFTSTEGFENIYTSEPVQKVIIDQKVYILRGEKEYTLTGQEVK